MRKVSGHACENVCGVECYLPFAAVHRYFETDRYSLKKSFRLAVRIPGTVARMVVLVVVCITVL